MFVVAIVVMGFDYGPMAKAELEAYPRRRASARSATTSTWRRNSRACLADMLLPVVVLIVFCIVGMLYVGGFWDPAAEGYMESHPGLRQHRRLGGPALGLA